MAVSKVIFGGNTLIDLTGDTVTASTLVSGATAHNKAGHKITGTAPDFDVLFPVGSFLLYPTNPSSIKGEWVKVSVILIRDGFQQKSCPLWQRVQSVESFRQSTFGFNGSGLQPFNQGTFVDIAVK